MGAQKAQEGGLRKLLFLRALTPVHAGVGRGASEHVDLPVQRDEFGFPCIWASSLKGAFRGGLERVLGGGEKENLYKAMGPPPERAYEHSSAVTFLDARLLLIPARSMRGVWTYITSPHLLGYLATYLEALGRAKEAEALKNAIAAFASIPVASKKEILVDENRMLAVLNELDVQLKGIDADLPQKLFGGLLPQSLLEAVKGKGLVVVDDDTALTLAQRSLLIQYRVRLKTDTKTVDVGPWAEEYLPMETVLVSGIICERAGKAGNKDACEWFENEALKRLGGVLWLGGKETVGKGLLEFELA